MFATLDYNSVIRTQYQDVEKGKKNIDFINSNIGKVINSLFSPKWLLRKVNNILTSQLVQSRGLLVTAKQQVLDIKDKDLNNPIFWLSKLLDLNISLDGDIDELIKEGEAKEYPDLHITKIVLSETIENLYEIIRILKKANIKSQKETSELAKDLSRRSVNSLEKVLYGR